MIEKLSNFEGNRTLSICSCICRPRYCSCQCTGPIRCTDEISYQESTELGRNSSYMVTRADQDAVAKMSNHQTLQA